jgi:hypothetical protein
MAVTIADHLSRLFENPHTTVVVTNVLGILFVIGLVVLALLLVDKDSPRGYPRAANCLVLLLGLFVGWSLALFWVPFDDTEKSVFAQVGATVSAFVAGYGISKFDKLLESTLYENGKPVRATVTRVALFVGAVILAAVVVVTNRVDWLSTENERLRADPVESQKRAQAASEAASVAAARAAAASAVAAARAAASAASGAQRR